MAIKVAKTFRVFETVVERVNKRVCGVCPYCIEAHRMAVAPISIGTSRMSEKTVKRYYRCRHPNCQEVFVAYVEEPQELREKRKEVARASNVEEKGEEMTVGRKYGKRAKRKSRKG